MVCGRARILLGHTGVCSLGASSRPTMRGAELEVRLLSFPLDSETLGPELVPE